MRVLPALLVLVVRGQAVLAVDAEHDHAAAADFASKEKGWKNAYVVADQFIAYAKSLSKYFAAQYKANGGEVIPASGEKTAGISPGAILRR